MEQKTTDAGIIAAALQRLNNFRLPRALLLKEKVDSGEPLNDFDRNFLRRVDQDAIKLAGIVERHPEYQELRSKMIVLCDSIRKKAAENEMK